MNLSLVFLGVAIVCFVIAALLAFGVLGGEHILGWISAGLAAFAASLLPLSNWTNRA